VAPVADQMSLRPVRWWRWTSRWTLETSGQTAS
jgi:hypothetical protein